jgi:hypothetical protein
VAHQSDSAEQRDAQELISREVEALIGKTLDERTVKLDSGAPVRVDGVDADETVFVEIFAHQGPVKGGQKHKVATDALKLITLGRSRPDADLILAFADKDAAAYATQGTWLSEALATWNVTVYVVELAGSVRGGIRAAQVRQEMVNPDATASPET